VSLASGLEGEDMMDIPSNDGLGDCSSTASEPGENGDTVGFIGIGPLTESEYERLIGKLVNGPGEKRDGWRSCAICLEEMDTDLRRHVSCSCVLCESCIDVSFLGFELILLRYLFSLIFSVR